MDRFSRFVASIDTPGGHVIVCLIVMVFGFVACKLGIAKEGGELITGGAAALFLSMRGRGSENHDLGAPQSGLVLPSESISPPTT